MRFTWNCGAHATSCRAAIAALVRGRCAFAGGGSLGRDEGCFDGTMGARRGGARSSDRDRAHYRAVCPGWFSVRFHLECGWRGDRPHLRAGDALSCGRLLAARWRQRPAATRVRQSLSVRRLARLRVSPFCSTARFRRSTNAGPNRLQLGPQRIHARTSRLKQAVSVAGLGSATFPHHPCTRISR